jgi:hypothetical protein
MVSTSRKVEEVLSPISAVVAKFGIFALLGRYEEKPNKTQ